MQEKDYYPLTSGQMILFYSQKYCVKKQVNNVCAKLEMKNEVDGKLLLQALNIAAMRYPSMNCRFTQDPQDKKRVVQYFADTIPEDIQMMDMHMCSETELEAELNRISATPFSNKCNDTQLYRIRLILTPNGRYTIYFCVCHLIMDAYALMAFVRYTEQVYASLLENKNLPCIRSTPIECYQADYAYFNSEKYEEDKAWWDRQMETEPNFTSINGVGAKEFCKGKRYGVSLRLWQVEADMKNLRIPKEVVEKIQTFTMSRRIAPQCAYLSAIRSYLSYVSQTEDVTIMNTVARRATVVQKNAGGTMVNAVPFRTIISGECSFTDALTDMYAVQRETYKHSSMPCGELLDRISSKHHIKKSLIAKAYQSTSVTFQPFFNTDNRYFEYSIKRLKNGAATLPLYISIMPYDSTGDLWVNYEYIVGYILPESIEKIHAFMIKFLSKGTECSDKSINELIKASM